MQSIPVEHAPVENVGGPQQGGPWPEELEEIAVDDRLKRPVSLNDGRTETREVAVTQIKQIVRETGEETDGYVVSYEHGGDDS